MSLNGTYSGLQASIADWLQRSDLTAAIPDFIALAEGQISRRLVLDGPVRQMVARADATISSEYIVVPTDFMGVRAFILNGSSSGRVLELDYCTPEQITDKKYNTNQQTGCPKFFSIVGPEFQFFPAPDTSYTGEITYYQRIPALSNGSPNNWLLTLYPDAYLYGSLLQSAPYLKEDSRVAVWEQAFAQVLADICATSKIEQTSARITVQNASNGTP